MTGTKRPSRQDGDDDDADLGFLKFFGTQLKILRKGAGLTQAQLGDLIGYGEDLVAAVEQGRRIPRPEFIDRADDALDAGGLLRAGKEEATRARYPAFFEDFAQLEKRAVELHAYDSQVINGLLQTEEYAQAVFSVRRPLLDEDTIQQRLAARLARQEIFNRWPAPLMSFVLEETLLRRPIGGKHVLRGQLEQLLLTGQKRNVEIQVMPTDRDDHAGLGGPLILIETQEQRRMAYVEVHGISRLITERKRGREIEARYGIIRAQALTPRESLGFIEKVLGEL